MTPEQSSPVIYDLLKSATLLTKQRFNDALADIDHYASLQERINLLGVYGTIRLSVGRQSGGTTAAIKLANEFFEDAGHRTLYFGPRPDAFAAMGAKEAHPWTQASYQNPTGVRAIFVDPGPHAGMQAQKAIYTLAAEAMLFEDELQPVLIYFIGS